MHSTREAVKRSCRGIAHNITYIPACLWWYVHTTSTQHSTCMTPHMQMQMCSCRMAFILIVTMTTRNTIAISSSHDQLGMCRSKSSLCMHDIVQGSVLTLPRCTSVHSYTHTHACTHTRTHTCTHARTHTHTHTNARMQVRTHARVHVCRSVCKSQAA